jgi:hypothetical protein
MGNYLVTLTNLSSIPSIIYFYKEGKNYYASQILLTSGFSFLHHINTSGVVTIYDNGLFNFLDGLYSYWLIYLFAIYLLLSNHNELDIAKSIVFTILLSLVYLSMNFVFILPIIGFICLSVCGCSYQKLNKISFNNVYLYAVLFFCTLDITLFSLAYDYSDKYNYYHSAHHLISFILPIFVDKYVTVSNQN